VVRVELELGLGLGVVQVGVGGVVWYWCCGWGCLAAIAMELGLQLVVDMP
jgi:hypothetical protein